MPRPNVLLILTDDTSPDYPGYGGGRAPTPNLDRIAREGAVAERFYSVAPVCTPSRYAWMTGHCPQRCPHSSYTDSQKEGEPSWVSFNTTYDPALETGLALEMRKLGYRCGFAGKWHTHGADAMKDAFDPDASLDDPNTAALLRERYAGFQDWVRSCGFDHADGIWWGNPDERPVRAARTHNLGWVTASALDFLDSQEGADAPFFLYVAPTALHGPHHLDSLYGDPRITEAGLGERDYSESLPPRRTIPERLERAGLPVNHHNVGLVWIDDLVGRLLERLGAMGELDHTLIIHSADHGCGNRGKFTLYEGGVRIPFAARLPGTIPAGSRLEGLRANVDLLPTLVEMAGGPMSADAMIDGTSFWPALCGDSSRSRDGLYVEFGYSRALVTEPWKYIARRPPDRLVDAMADGEQPYALNVAGNFRLKDPALYARKYPAYFETDQLFDLEADPCEQNNLFYHPECADIARDLRTTLAKKCADFEAPFVLDAVHPYLQSAEHRRLCETTREAMDLWEVDWYRRGS